MNHLYSVGFASQNKLVGQTPRTWGDYRPLADKLNRMNKTHAAEVKSLPQLLSDELRGAFSHHMPTIARVLKEIAEEHFKKTATPDDVDGAKATAPKLASMFAHLFEDGRIADFVPTLVVRATLAASVRWDKKRQYRENDYHDFSHAVAALPYFDVFATEKSLAHLTSNDLKLDKRYGTKVVKTNAELIAAPHPVSI